MSEALVKGFEFMIMGMLVVFSFLVLMILVMKLSQHLVTIINKYIPEEEAMENPLQRSVHSHDDVAVAIAAVKNFTKN